MVEYLRVDGRLRSGARVWLFPLLAAIGAGLLLPRPLARLRQCPIPGGRGYYINPALDPDGNPHADPSPTVTVSDPPNHAAMNIEPSTENHGDDGGTHSSHVSAHHHEMNDSMLLVKREHFWFMVLGLGIAIFKFLSDSGTRLSRFSSFVWPSAMVLSGALLIFYRE